MAERTNSRTFSRPTPLSRSGGTTPRPEDGHRARRPQGVCTVVAEWEAEGIVRQARCAEPRHRRARRRGERREQLDNDEANAGGPGGDRDRADARPIREAPWPLANQEGDERGRGAEHGPRPRGGKASPPRLTRLPAPAQPLEPSAGQIRCRGPRPLPVAGTAPRGVGPLLAPTSTAGRRSERLASSSACSDQACGCWTAAAEGARFPWGWPPPALRGA